MTHEPPLPRSESWHARTPTPAQVTAKWLAAQRPSSKNLRIVDVCRHTAGDSPIYLPGAVHLNWERAFGKPPAIGPSPLVLASELSRLGIGDDHVIVLYDEGRDARALAAYRWLRRYGHSNTFVLAGGRAEWLRRRGPISHEQSSYAPSSFTVRMKPQRHRTAIEWGDVLMLQSETSPSGRAA
ncbi:MAG: rhodanese-like domain-containing protein [Polyangiaceae bacterium]